jgi:protocatechuate 3,4-dioxygenase beta subunit
MILTPELGRRRVMHGLAAVALTPLLPRGAAFADPALAITPPQTEGPFYPRDWSGDVDSDLVVVRGEAAQALGQITHVTGRILDASGTPISGAAIEIWQCDANGVYRHPADMQGPRVRDGKFQGRGRALSAADGSYTFRTIRPVAYPGRTPHIHFAVAAPGRERLITQMYVAGEPLNARDGILNAIRDPRQRASVIVPLEPAERLEAGALAGTFDIILAG